MPNRHKFIAAITQITENGAFLYPGNDIYRGEVTFSSTFNHCYFKEVTLTKVKGGQHGANYKDIINEDLYRFSVF